MDDRNRKGWINVHAKQRRLSFCHIALGDCKMSFLTLCLVSQSACHSRDIRQLWGCGLPTHHIWGFRGFRRQGGRLRLRLRLSPVSVQLGVFVDLATSVPPVSHLLGLRIGQTGARSPALARVLPLASIAKIPTSARCLPVS